MPSLGSDPRIDVLVRTLLYVWDHEWSTAREIARGISTAPRGETSPNRALYAFPHIFERRDDYIPRWRVRADFRGNFLRGEAHTARREQPLGQMALSRITPTIARFAR